MGLKFSASAPPHKYAVQERKQRTVVAAFISLSPPQDQVLSVFLHMSSP